MTAERSVNRTDFLVDRPSGGNLIVREVRPPAEDDGRQTPLLLVHGARVPGLASFDLPVANGSLAGDLAAAGYPVYIMDVGGYGRSTRQDEFKASPESHPPLVRAPEAARDIATVVEEIVRRTNNERIAILGWATGGMWAGLYTLLHRERVSRLILCNTLYRSPDHPTLGRGSDLEDPGRPGQFNAGAIGAYRYNTAESLIGGWDASIPVAEKDRWRDPVVRDAYVQAALESDETSDQRTPPSFRSPSGALEDSFYQATGRQIWDASQICAPVLIIASEKDFWSMPIDRRLLQEHLVHSPEVRLAVIPDATHFVHLDRPEHGRSQFIEEVISFLSPSHRNVPASLASSVR